MIEKKDGKGTENEILNLSFYIIISFVPLCHKQKNGRKF